MKLTAKTPKKTAKTVAPPVVVTPVVPAPAPAPAPVPATIPQYCDTCPSCLQRQAGIASRSISNPPADRVAAANKAWVTIRANKAAAALALAALVATTATV